jgi:hypothetical protein
MHYAKDHQTLYLFDPWVQLGPKRRQILDTGWPGLFRKCLLNKLPADRLARKFKEFRGRPTKDLYVMLGAMVLQNMLDLSDEETRDALLFRVDWQYALDITDPSDAQVYVSEKTWRSYRQYCIKYEIDTVAFGELTGKLIELFGVDTSHQRLDSTHLISNMRKLGRTGLFVATIKKFLKRLSRSRKESYANLPPELVARYMAKDADACFSRVKPSEAGRTLQKVAEDLALLVEQFRSDTIVQKWDEYRYLERVLREQCTVTGSGQEAKVTVKPPKTVSPDCLQNPSEPDAGYSGHKGPGFQDQLMETYQPGEKRDPKIPNVFTYTKTEPANEQDINALHPAIDSTRKRQCCPKTLLADTKYGSDENVEKAKEKGVDLIAPVGGKATPKSITLGLFVANPSTCLITRCPQGHAPTKVTRTDTNRLNAVFSLEVCRNCPRLPECPVTMGKKAATLYYTEAQLRCAYRRLYEKSPVFNDAYRWRSGIEGGNSHLKSETGMGRLRVRGLGAVRFAVTLKVLGLNIKRCARALNARISEGLPPFLGLDSPVFGVLSPSQPLCITLFLAPCGKVTLCA